MKPIDLTARRFVKHRVFNDVPHASALALNPEHTFGDHLCESRHGIVLQPGKRILSTVREYDSDGHLTFIDDTRFVLQSFP